MHTEKTYMHNMQKYVFFSLLPENEVFLNNQNNYSVSIYIFMLITEVATT